MAAANVGKSGSYLVDLSSADDLWRKIAEAMPQPPALQRIGRRASRPPQFAAQESTTGGVEKIRAVQSKSAGFVSNGWDKMSGRVPSVETPAMADPWSRGERRLWIAAGSLMGLAVAVLTVFALVTFGSVSVPVAAPASPIPGVPELAATPLPASTSTPAHDANTFRPPLPALVRSESPHAPTVARKHGKHHKTKRAALN